MSTIMIRTSIVVASAALFAVIGAVGDDVTASAPSPHARGQEGGPARFPRSRSPLGSNLAPVCDWSTERPFADLFKQSRPWISNTDATWDDGRRLDLDAHGWVRSLLPGQRARSLVMWGEPVPRGDYVVTWTGDGELDFWPQDAQSAGARRAVIRADPARGGLAVTVVRTHPGNPVRDIRVWPAGLEGRLFHPAFLESLRPYAALRFMDWMSTNETSVRSWHERARVEDARWSVKGVPLEVMVDLANATHSDPWITIPHTWDDDAVARAAALVHARLDPNLRVWVEHSNEVWNDMFPQAEHARRRGLAHKRARDPFEAQLREHAARSVEIFAPWERSFVQAPRRLVRVLGAMAVSPWATEVLLSDAAVAARVDALAIAPYFGGSLGGAEHATRTRTLSLDAIFDAIDASIDEMTARVRAHWDIVAARGIALVAYEGGQHLVGVGRALEDERLGALFLAANRDPRMKTAYLRALRGWRDAGGTLFVHYLDVAAPSKHGMWGARESLTQPRSAAPKWDALVTFMESTPTWWEG